MMSAFPAPFFLIFSVITEYNIIPPKPASNKPMIISISYFFLQRLFICIHKNIA